MPLSDRLASPVGNGKDYHSTQGLIQLSVVVEKDEVGYGLTVSGDKPVYVQQVKENGASAKAGVRIGDRIYKVNGASVANCDHTEVVNMIKSGSQVALTLFRKPESHKHQHMAKVSTSPSLSSGGSSVVSGGSDRITHPRPANTGMRRTQSLKAQQEQSFAKEKIETVKRMYLESVNNENKLQQEYSKSKNPKLEVELNDAKKTTGAIRKQLEALTDQPASNFLKPTTSRNSVCIGDLQQPNSIDLVNTSSVPPSTHRPLKASWSIGSPFFSREQPTPRLAMSGGATNRSVKRSNSDTSRKADNFSHQLLPLALKRKLMMKKAVSMPASVDTPDSCVVRPHSTITENSVVSGTTSPHSDETDDESLLRKNEVKSPVSLASKISSSNIASEIISMDDDEFPAESQNVVKDHGPFNDFELLRNKHAHCSVFLSFLISNDDPAPLLFTLVSDLYTTGTVRDMKRWAYEIHSTFVARNAPLAIKLDDDSIIDSIENALKRSVEKEDVLKGIFDRARSAASEVIVNLLADFRIKRDLGLGTLFGDGELRDDIDKTTEQRIIDKTLRPHYEKYAGDESAGSHAMTLALATVMKEWGVNRGGIERQASFAMKDPNKTGIRSVIGNRFSRKNKEMQLFSHPYSKLSNLSSIKFNDSPIFHLLVLGDEKSFVCTTHIPDCDLNLHKECISQVGLCKKKKGKDKKEKQRLSLINMNPKKPSGGNTRFHINLAPSMSGSSSTSHLGVAPARSTHKRSRSFGSSMLDDVQPQRDGTSSTAEEDLPGAHSVSKLKERFEKGLNGAVATSTDTPISTAPEQTTLNVGRSESFNEKSSRIKAVTDRRAKSDVDKGQGEVLEALDKSQSSSSASASSLQSNKSDSSSTEKVSDSLRTASSLDDSDLDMEDSMPSIDSILPKDALRKMKPKEKKLQEVVNELFYTEKSHVRNLKLLDHLFHQPMSQLARSDSRIRDLVDIIFPSLPALKKVHVELNDDMKRKMKENPLVPIKDVVDILTRRFDGEAGDKMKEVCANFCRNHTYALNALKEKRRRDAKLEALLTSGENDKLCRRLQLKDLMIAEVHRLTKYPLLVDTMCKYTSANSVEHKQLMKVSGLTKDILADVNRAVKDCENQHRLVALQQRLDTRPIQSSSNPLVKDHKNLNLVDYKLVYEGQLTWRLSTSAKKLIDLHVILLEEILVLLQVQDDNKLVLKCQSQLATGGKEDSKFGHSPIITLNSMLVRQVATDKKAFFIINTSELGPQIYDLVASSVEEKKRWLKYISEAADSHKKSSTGTATRRNPPAYSTKITLSEEEAASQSGPDVKAQDPEEELTKLSSNNNLTLTEDEEQVDEPPAYDQLQSIASNQLDISATASKSTTEILNEKDELIKLTLSEKESIVARALNIPEQDYSTVAEVATAIEGEKDSKSLVLASISDTMQLTALLNSKLSIPSPKETPGPPERSASLPNPPTSSPSAVTQDMPSSTPLSDIQLLSKSMQQQISVVTNLSKKLNSLLEILEEDENERARLRCQLQAAEQLLREAPRDHGDSRPNSFISNSSSNTSACESPDYNSSGLAASSAASPGVGQNTSAFSLEAEPDQCSVTTEEDESDSDDGTVYAADNKDELAEDKSTTLRPDSSLSDVSNSHTDNTLKSVESIPDKTSCELNNSTTSNSLSHMGPSVESDSSEQEQTTCPVIMTIDSATSSESSDSDALNSLKENKKNSKHDTYTMVNIMSVAAGTVEKAVTTAMNIIKRDRVESTSKLVGCPEGADPLTTAAIDCDTIQVDFASDGEPNRESFAARHSPSPHNDIDDSDEADALSASSLD